MANIRKETTFGQDVLHGLRGFFKAVGRGEPITVRTVRLELEPRRHAAADVKRIRRRLGVSQAIFSQLLAVSVKLVQAWEQGLRRPEPIACRLLDDIEADPRRWLARLEKAAGSAKMRGTLKEAPLP